MVNQTEPTLGAQPDGLPNPDFHNHPRRLRFILALVVLVAGIAIRYIQW